MNRNFARFIPVVALAAALSVSANAQSAAAPATTPATPAATSASAGPLKIGVVDMQAAIVSCNEGQRDFGELAKTFEPKRTQIEGMNKEVEELKKQFSAQGDKLNGEARDNLLKQIDTKTKTLNRTVEDAQADAQQRQQEIVSRIGQKMYAVLEKLARTQNYSLILDVGGQQNPVMWASETTNITPALVKAYNEQSGVPAPAAPAQGATGAAKPAGATTRPAGTTAKPATTPTKP